MIVSIANVCVPLIPCTAMKGISTRFAIATFKRLLELLHVFLR